MRSPVFFFQKMELQLTCQLAQKPWQPSLGQLCLLVSTLLMEYLHEHQKLVQTAPRLNRNNCHMGAAPQIFIQRNYPSSHTLYKETMETPSQICNIPARNEPMNDVWKWWKLDLPTWKVLHSEGSFLHIFTAVNSATHSPYDLENSSKTPPL